MFKRHNQLLTALRVALDLLIVGGAFWGGWGLRCNRSTHGEQCHNQDDGARRHRA